MTACQSPGLDSAGDGTAFKRLACRIEVKCISGDWRFAGACSGGGLGYGHRASRGGRVVLPHGRNTVTVVVVFVVVIAGIAALVRGSVVDASLLEIATAMAEAILAMMLSLVMGLALNPNSSDVVRDLEVGLEIGRVGVGTGRVVPAERAGLPGQCCCTASI